MVRLLVIILIMTQIGCVEGSLKQRIKDFIYAKPVTDTTNVHTVTIQKTWEFEKQKSYKGFAFTLMELDKRAIFKIYLSTSDSYTVNKTEEDLLVPQDVSISVANAITADVGGTVIGNIKSKTRRTEFIVTPTINVNWFEPFVLNPKWRKGLQVSVGFNSGVGWQFLNYVDSTKYTVKVLDSKGKKITIPLTGSGSDDTFAFTTAGFISVGIIHIEPNIIYYFPSGLRYSIGIGATW